MFWLSGVFLLAIVGYFVSRIISSPLSTVPTAHWSARYSSVWILWKRYYGKELNSLVKAHRKHGPIVLVGPQELSVSCYQDGVRKVYDSGFPKPAPFYSMFTYFRRRNAFTSLGRKEHGVRRKRTAALYSKSSIMQSQHLVDVTNKIIYDGLHPKLDGIIKDTGKADGLDMSYCLCADYLTAFVFGHSNGSNFQSQTKAEVDEWRFHYENSMCHASFYVQEMPHLYRVLKMAAIDLLPNQYGESRDFLEDWMSSMAAKADQTPVEEKPTVYQAAKEAVQKDSPGLGEEVKRREVKSEMFDHISAAREVLGLVLAYTFWYLAQHPDAQQRVLDELATNDIDMSEPDTSIRSPEKKSRAAKLDSLPYLRAVIHESLRMRPNSTPLPRITPPDKTVSVAGVDGIPPGTRINSFQWFIHRDAEKWSHVHVWEPERWLEHDNSDEDVLWAFASGPRMCLGNHFTYYAMQHIIAAILSRFVLTALPRKEDLGSPGDPEDELPIQVSLRN